MGMVSETSSVSSDDVDSVGSGSNSMLAQVAVLLKSQAEALTAQAKVVSLQSLPTLPMYTGESRDITDDSFELWSENFQERASVSWWSEEQKHYQLKFHLDKTAAEVFCVLPREEKNSFKMAMESMKLTVV